MDTQTFLLERETIQAEMSVLRSAAAPGVRPGHLAWWTSLPLQSMAGWFMKNSGLLPQAHRPWSIVTKFLTSGAVKLGSSFLRQLFVKD